MATQSRRRPGYKVVGSHVLFLCKFSNLYVRPYLYALNKFCTRAKFWQARIKMPAENELGDWFRSIPVVTRWWFSLSIVFTLLGRFGLLNIMYMFLSFDLVAYKFQVNLCLV